MDGIKDDIIDVLQSLSSIAEENSAASEETSATMEQQNASIDEIADQEIRATKAVYRND